MSRPVARRRRPAAHVSLHSYTYLVVHLGSLQLRSWSPTRPHITPARRRRRRRLPAGGETFWGFLHHFHWGFACNTWSTWTTWSRHSSGVVGAAGMAVWRGGPTPGDTSLTLEAFGTASKTIKLGLYAKEKVEIIDVTFGFDIHRLW